MPRFYLSVCCLISLSSYLPAQDTIVDIKRLDSPIQLDGRLDEAAWQDIPTLPLIMQTPNFGQPPTERSEVFLTYDNDYLYLAGRLHLSRKEYVRPTAFKRDAFDGTTDYFGLILDSFHDKENAVAFFTGPTGFRWDGVVFNDAQGELPISIDWNTFWDVATTYDDEGWTAEMRIPWTSLRFQDVDGSVTMGVILWWYIAAKNELDIYPAVPPNWGQWSSWKPSQMQTIRFRDVYSRKPLYLAPYILGGLEQSLDLNESETAYLKNDDPTLEAGLDIKYGITNNLTLDLTVNTDFAQVEADDQQVNLTRFSLFFPEKRLFFQERASIFDFNFDEFNRLFYSRRIGLDEDGNPVRIYGGARLVGRIGRYDMGFLNMQTQRAGELPSENFGVLRLRRQLSKSNSYLGGILTSRLSGGGKYHTGLGLDGIFHLKGDDYLNVKWAQTFDDQYTHFLFSPAPARWYVDYERRSFQGLSYKTSISRVGADYLPDVGFELRSDYTSLAPNVAYGWLMGQQSKWFSVQLFTDNYILQNNSSGIIETARAAIGARGNTKNGTMGEFKLNYQHEFVTDTFELSDEALVPTGTYDFAHLTGSIVTPFQNFFGAMINWQIGSFYDGNLQSVGVAPRLKLSAHFDLEGNYQFNRGRFRDRGQTFIAHLGRLKLFYALDTKFSVAAFLQYNSLDRIYAGNIRLRYNPREGVDLYLVYNDLINGDRHREFPVLPFSSQRTLVLKYTYTLGL